MIPVKFRDDLYGGPSLWVWPDEEDAKGILVTLNAIGTDAYTGCYQGITFTLIRKETPTQLELEVEITNTNATDFRPKRCELRLGIDTYMEKFPDWDERFFPTMIRCEATHTWGYFTTPKGDRLVLASKGPIASWHHSYSRASYGSPDSDPGHRIYTTSLDLLNKGPLPKRHPQTLHTLKPNETKRFVIALMTIQSEEEILPTVAAYTGAPFISLSKYTFEYGEALTVHSDGLVTLTSPSGKVYTILELLSLTEYGVWQITSQKDDKISEALIYVRQPWSYYMQKAREAALTYEQKAATHTESWYGFFSAFLARKYFPDEALDAQLEAKFEEVFKVMHTFDPIRPVEAALPWRIQNSALMISVLVDAYEATNKIHYLEHAAQLADHLMTYQSLDGVFQCHGVHYTCVIYIAKSMLELYLAEKQLNDEVWQKRAKIHYASAKRSIDELQRSADDIQTEGEMTFEDGMISCSSLQLGMFALLQEDSKREPYLEVAEYMLHKHRCLELTQIPDCRMRGATLRFWETTYDVLIPQGMMTSPHGWTSWKTYATYYLYLLTGKKNYLVETMDTVGSCMQVIDITTGKLRWAFITDPYVEADLFVQDETSPNKGKLVKKVVGEQYIDMISDWWQSDPSIVSAGYAFPSQDLLEGYYQGGACDNDVHEHFKCLEEVALTKSYIHEDAGDLLAYNCQVTRDNNTLTITPSEQVVNQVIVHLDQPTTLVVPDWSITLTGQKGFNHIYRP